MPKSVIAISGSPGTGKSALARLLEKEGYYRLDVHNHYKEISTSYNRSKMCYDVDLKKFKKLVKSQIKEHPKLVIDSHISHLLPKKWVDLCIVLICSDLRKLKRRLKKRKYSEKKIRENLDAEIFQICLVEAEEERHNVKVFDTSKLKSKKIVSLISL